jgi:hypothetical protein
MKMHHHRARIDGGLIYQHDQKSGRDLYSWSHVGRRGPVMLLVNGAVAMILGSCEICAPGQRYVIHTKAGRLRRATGYEANWFEPGAPGAAP